MSEALLTPFNLTLSDVLWPRQVNLFVKNRKLPFGCLIYHQESNRVSAHFGNDVDTNKGSHHNVELEN